ncbi:unnamed protein product [Durusdinium trenchii]|uniref:Uncharacterized protein n=1 Tax=Durusdinium trenchii TaxID=1381693 RepID=A0ABP0N725_9DINO
MPWHHRRTTWQLLLNVLATMALDPNRTAEDMCGFVANSNVGWTGQETVEWPVAGPQECCDICTSKSADNPPCVAWVWIHDTHCYQKYDTGEYAVTQSLDSLSTDSGTPTGTWTGLKVERTGAAGIMSALAHRLTATLASVIGKCEVASREEGLLLQA